MAILLAVALAVTAGFIALGVEATGWYKTQRAMQNASDAAAIAAAMNGTNSYADEAKAVAASYGFTDGVNNTTVNVQQKQSCPDDGTNSCYRVAIQQVVSNTAFTKFVYNSPFSLGAQAQAKGQGAPHGYCLLALGTSGANPALQTNGAPKANMAGCSLMSNTGATCSGHSLEADYGDAHYTNNGCGNVQTSDVPVVADPYAYLKASIPADSCGGSYPQIPDKKGTPLPASNQWSGSKALSGTTTVCGDLQLTGDVTISTTTGAGAVLVIQNGMLDTGSYTLKTTAGSGLTIIFSGTNDYHHVIGGGGTLDFAAPTSGTWSGIAIYQDPALTMNVDMTFAGNSPTWDITGVIYLPHAGVTFSGAINKSSNGLSCFVLVADNILINGTGSILAHDQCGSAGVTMPSGASTSMVRLVN